ncbi:MAG: M20/M25/M40 family metallo-hydrolase [Oscillospiraceae bacterium]|nr:M20/M25/M40 family metallo-hydrolase [Oscillospiraceae bacterium]
MKTFNTFDTLKRLTAANGVAGSTGASETALELLKEFAPDAYIDCHGSVVGTVIGEHIGRGLGVRDDSPSAVLLDAHIDQVGLVITHVDEKGFIKAEPCGGIDRRAIAAQAVTVYGKKLVKGVICTKPPHVLKRGEEDKVIKADEIWIDAGLNANQAVEIISPGDTVTIDGTLTAMPGNIVSGPALDNRAGVCAILYALHLLKNVGNAKSLPPICVSFSVQEELGCRGAAVAAYNADPEYAVVVDVSYGLSPGLENKASTSVGRLGEGPMIGYAPSLNRGMFEGLKKTAVQCDIPYQLEIMSKGTSGTNADPIGIVRGGVKTALVSIPLRYMHTPVETVALSDIEAVGKLIAEFVEKCLK